MKTKNPKSSAQLVLEEKLAQAAWHEALVRITSGLVHDTNNCLAGIVSLSEHCLVVGDRKESFKEELTLINQSGLKAGQILKTFVQLNPTEPEECNFCDLNALTEDSVELLRRVLKRRLELELQLGPGPLPVFLEALELKKAIICLAFNLADAMSERGKITFQTYLHTDSAPPRYWQGIWPKAPCVCLSLVSTAQGVEPVPWESLFDFGLTGNELTDAFRLRFCLIKQIMEKAHGAVSIEVDEATGHVLRFFVPKADLEL